jgi:hypothetical protein
MKLSTKNWRSGLVMVGVVVALLGSTTAFARNANPGVFPIQSRPYGQTYGQWSARWWQYGFSVPGSTSVKDVFDGCPAEPSSQMWFLVGTIGGPGQTIRSCTVPTGRAIMFPVLNVEWSAFEADTTPGSCLVPASPSGDSDPALQACATAQANHALDSDATLTATVDNVPLQNLTNYRAVSQPFDFTSAPLNPLGVCQPQGCNSRAVADGFWIILTPLSPGTHTIQFTANIPFFGFTADILYNLTIQPGH